MTFACCKKLAEFVNHPRQRSQWKCIDFKKLGTHNEFATKINWIYKSPQWICILDCKSTGISPKHSHYYFLLFCFIKIHQLPPTTSTPPTTRSTPPPWLQMPLHRLLQQTATSSSDVFRHCRNLGAWEGLVHAINDEVDDLWKVGSAIRHQKFKRTNLK